MWMLVTRNKGNKATHRVLVVAAERGRAVSGLSCSSVLFTSAAAVPCPPCLARTLGPLHALYFVLALLCGPLDEL